MAAVAADKEPGICLEWSNIDYSVMVRDAESKRMVSKRILTNISGKATPGTLTLLMGPSGAGWVMHKAVRIGCGEAPEQPDVWLRFQP
jgi:ABC-type transporter Mla maintaining outer membrane lipid asymmetry ATPase subunit MlaF